MKLELSIDNINEMFKAVLSLVQTEGGVEFVGLYNNRIHYQY